MHRTLKKNSARQRRYAIVFAALGDETRLQLMSKLTRGNPLSISELSEGAKITRQAITKHLRVLEDAGVVHSTRVNRENLFELNPKPIADITEYLSLVSSQWDNALSRLKSFVED